MICVCVLDHRRKPIFGYHFKRRASQINTKRINDF